MVPNVLLNTLCSVRLYAIGYQFYLCITWYYSVCDI